ncbi:proton-conducting transporter membrane subunit [Flexivirga oryzae]|uniref:NADH:ubiquinone oxidoreductase subunit 5 (Subunit L)/multisubunit Na+/H+ antiporter MnhA subunit n=1 Tax=Flexivirga oryzae TaxID=1794944 RepID=A0A839N8V5_9MICO|nr:NADH:ubiquinone oxidoreductase subunit 5 (subunit L)/multisubunit Na+/H+ antiporter MnhA subunit [Flexivirga oryzae]
MSALLWALVLLPALAGVGLLAAPLGPSPVRRAVERATPTVGISVATGVLALSAAAASVRPTTSAPFLAGDPFTLAVDGLSAVVVVTVAAVSLLVLVFSAGAIRHHRARFVGLMLVFVAAVLVTATTTTLLGLLMAWEVMGATSYALIAFDWRRDTAVASGTTAFVVTRAGDVGLYLAAGAALAVASGGTPGLSLDRLALLPSPWLHIAAAGMLAAAFGKAAQLPFSFWLSRAMDGPSPVSALLHSAAMVAMGGYLLLRLHPLLLAAGWAATTAAWVGALTALLLGAVAIAQDDLKQLLAASTSAQLGFVVLAAGTTGPGAVGAGLAHLVGHASTKALLFLAAGAWLAALGTKSLPALRGAGRAYPWVGVPFTVAALALAGVPPLTLWATKESVLAAAREQSGALYAVGLAAAVASSAYAGKALALIWRRLPDHPTGYDTEEAGTRQVGWIERIPLLPLAVGAAGLGVLVVPAVWAKVDPGAPTPTSASAGEVAVSVVLAVVVTGVALRWPQRLPAPRWAGSWLRLEQVAHAGVLRPTLRLAALLARGDAALEAAVTGTGHAGRRLADHAAAIDAVGVGGALRGVVAAARRGAGLALRPQTGQLHQYYAQASVGLAVAVLIVWLAR